LLGATGGAAELGSITLLPHQREAVTRLRCVIADHGGALLADEVGLGKTYVALALAREASNPLVVAPAALRPMWQEALHAAEIAAPIVTYEALSRGDAARTGHDFLVLDEAHHARTPATNRYRRLSALAARARVLLVTATPVHNRRGDLAALLALFLGERAWLIDDTELARCVVRREHRDVRRPPVLPRAALPQSLRVADDEETMRRLLLLPPPLPPRDGGDGGVLLTWSLVRQWASSRGALTGALSRRLARAAALGSALEQGRYPARAELSAWCCADNAVQLAFPELLAPAEPNADALLAVVRAHERAVRVLLDWVERQPNVDLERAARLRELRALHAGERMVAFTQYGDTADALFRLLRHDPGIATLSGRGARVASGPLSRLETLRRFAPSAAGAAEPREADRIDLLLTTDLLSEGVDLRDASVVVHLDLPWTVARIEQRVGRSRRLGARHQQVAVYALAPPASAEAVLELERRLHEKLRAASRSIGIAGAILPSLARPPDGEPTSPVRAEELIRAELEAWVEQTPSADGAPATGRDPLPAGRIAVAAVRAPMGAGVGALVVVRDGGCFRLLAVVGDDVSREPATVLEAVRGAAGGDAGENDDRAAGTIDLVSRWLDHERAADDAGIPLALGSNLRRRALRRIAAITARAPLHRRPLLSALAAEARLVAATTYGVGAERVLAELAVAAMPDEAWLRAVNAFGEVHRPVTRPRRAAPTAADIAAVLLLELDG
ncbi:MAG: DEAD/DEAH box helicase, partial [Gemmatimonadota bacterium]|nr:DEAD/DEAH box helicase [Gemmatimonadota bacterium]